MTSATSPNDGNFVLDGMVWPDRRPKPAMWEHRALAAPVGIAAAGDSARAGSRSHNRQHFRDLTGSARVGADGGRRDRSHGASSTLPAIGPGERGDGRRCPGWPPPAAGAGEAFLTTRCTTARGVGLGAGRVRGLLRASCRPGGASARRRSAEPAAGRSGRSAAVDDAGAIVHPRAGLAADAWRSGVPRPTTTASVAWPARWAGRGSIAWSRRRLGRAGRRGAATVVARASSTGAAGIVSRTSVGSRALAGGALRVEETARSRRSSTDLPRVGTVLEIVPGLEDARVVRAGPARDLPGPAAKRPRRSLATRPSTDQHARTSGRRRTAAGPTSAGSAAPAATGRGVRLDLDGRARCRDALPGRRPRGGDPRRRPRRRARRRSSTSMPPTAAWAPRAAARTRSRSTSSARARTAGRGRSATCAGALSHDDRVARRRPPVPSRERSAQPTSCASSRTARSVTSTSVRRCRSVARTATSGRTVRRASRTGSAIRSHSSTRRAGAATSACRRSSSSCRRLDRRSTSPIAITGSCAGKPAARPACRRRTSRPTTRPTRSRSTLADDPTGLEVDLRFTIFRDRPVVARSARIRNAGAGRGRPALRDEPRPRPAGRATGTSSELSRRVGARARTSSSAGSCRAGSRSRAPGARRATSTTRSSPCAARRPSEAHGEAYRLQPRLLGQLPRRGRGRAVRHDPGPARHRARDVRLAPGARAPVRHARGGRGLLGRWARRACARRSTGCSASGWRGRRGAIGRDPCSSTTGRRPTSTSTRSGSSTIASAARDLGIELFVLDDGWFGQRDDDTTSLGDWVVDRRKLPDGIDGVARRITSLGIGFGLWIEPEMVSARSRLFEAHPDWAIGIPGRPRTESRQQLVLDLSRPEVVDHLVDVLSEVLGSAPISYVKWDMNRNITEPFIAVAPGRSPGRVLPPLHPRRVRAVPAADRPRSPRSCSSRAPAVAGGSIRGCWPSRRRAGRATTPTPSSACGSSGAPRWRTR